MRTTDEEYLAQAADAQRRADQSKSPLDQAAWQRLADGFRGLVHRSNGVSNGK